MSFRRNTVEPAKNELGCNENLVITSKILEFVWFPILLMINELAFSEISTCHKLGYCEHFQAFINHRYYKTKKIKNFFKVGLKGKQKFYNNWSLYSICKVKRYSVSKIPEKNAAKQ